MIYLASQSPRRRQILKKMGIRFRAVSSGYVEKHRKCLPSKLVREHAVGKAKAAKVQGRRGFVLGADTLVYAGGNVLGKPKNESEALRMLRLICGCSHVVYTGLALLDLETGKILEGFCKTRVFVKPMTRSEMKSYIQKVNSYDKAGAYAIQMRPFIVEKIQGSYSNVVGLPEELLREFLTRRQRRGQEDV